VDEFLAKNKIIVIPNRLYSPDLALCDLFHFPKLEVVLKGRRFNDTTMIQAISGDALAHCQTVHFM
jgi:hypothetical protein